MVACGGGGGSDIEARLITWLPLYSGWRKRQAVGDLNLKVCRVMFCRPGRFMGIVFCYSAPIKKQSVLAPWDKTKTTSSLPALRRPASFFFVFMGFLGRRVGMFFDWCWGFIALRRNVYPLQDVWSQEGNGSIRRCLQIKAGGGLSVGGGVGQPQTL